MRSFEEHLPRAEQAARTGGDILRADFHRASGPRGEGDKAPADTEAEQAIRDILLAGDPDFGFLGEETGSVPGSPGAPVWVVDPNDGTRDYVRGRRGSAVSIALVHEGRPVMGVVHPFGYPDDRGCMYTAVEGRAGVFKDGAPCEARLAGRLEENHVVLVSGGGDRAAQANLECTRPARVMAIPSIAHRLARVAAGEAQATTSLYSPKTWDFGAGHFLVLAAGGVIIDENRRPPVYGPDGMGSMPRLFAGSQAVAEALCARKWDEAFRAERDMSVPVARLRKGGATRDPELLSRAQGAFLGHLVGSGKAAPCPGQLGASGELAVAAARSLLGFASDSASLARTYAEWTASGFPESDPGMMRAAVGQPSASSLSALALARVTPLSLWGWEADENVLVSRVAEDAALTHPSPLVGQSAAVLAVALVRLIGGHEASAALDAAHAFARRSGYSREVIEAILDSSTAPRAVRASEDADVRLAVRAAFFAITSLRSFSEAQQAATLWGRPGDALHAIVGALAGARFGRESLPPDDRTALLSCRPLEGFTRTPRPAVYWGTDALTMAEALLTAR